MLLGGGDGRHPAWPHAGVRRAAAGGRTGALPCARAISASSTEDSTAARAVTKGRLPSHAGARSRRARTSRVVAQSSRACRRTASPVPSSRASTSRTSPAASCARPSPSAISCSSRAARATWRTSSWSVSWRARQARRRCHPSSSRPLSCSAVPRRTSSDRRCSTWLSAAIASARATPARACSGRPPRTSAPASTTRAPTAHGVCFHPSSSHRLQDGLGVLDGHEEVVAVGMGERQDGPGLHDGVGPSVPLGQ